jgi:hypothetical protein
MADEKAGHPRHDGASQQPKPPDYGAAATM